MSTDPPPSVPHGILHHSNSNNDQHNQQDEPRRVSIMTTTTNNTGHVNQGYHEDETNNTRANGGHRNSSMKTSDNNSESARALAAVFGFKEEEKKWWVKFGPSLQQISRLAAHILLGFLAWGVIFIILGEPASPFGGPLFQIAVLCIIAKLGGWLATRVRLPSLLGMLVVGIAAKNFNLIIISGDYLHIVAEIRKVALVIILIRAGLDLDPKATRKLFGTIMKLGFGPWLVECCVIAISSYLFLGLPWGWAFMLGSIEAAVSPAVVVPGLLRLRLKGFGVAKGIPTLILAVTGIDDAFSVAAFGVISSILFATGSIYYTISLGPLSVIIGVAFGIIWGNLTRIIPLRSDPFAAHLRVLLLFFGGLIAVFGSDELGIGGAGPLGIILAAYVQGSIWMDQGWEVENNPVAIAFEVFWLIFEPILFGLTGTQIDFSSLDSNSMYVAIACIIVAAVIRVASTIVLAIGSKLNLKEKIFISFSWMAKATVQAALGPVAIDLVRPKDNPEEDEYARTVLMVCVLSIILTAPIGAVTIALSGPRLLKRTAPPVTDGWRRSARPSLRDITIHEEDEPDSDLENSAADQSVENNPQKNTEE